VALGIARRLDTYLSANQLGITLASLALGWIGEPAFAGLLQPLFASFGAWSVSTAHAGLTGANAGKFTVATLAKNYTFWSGYFSLRQARKIKRL
jgi:CBS domain containing-hemolysin-like protein